MTLRHKIIAAFGAWALVGATWGGIAYANDHDLHACYNSGQLASDPPPRVPHSRVEVRTGYPPLGPRWFVCVHHISSDD